MTRRAPHDPIQQLLAERVWLQRLARALVRDRATADDLVQDAYVAALDAPGVVRRPRAWLATILRNRWRNRVRADGRRAAHEHRARPRAHTETPEEVLARAELIERVAQAALELKEPYRTAVVLRYMEARTPADIAARLGVPIETVRTRLRRALQQLRVRLDAAHGGDRRRWTLALGPILHTPSAGLVGVPVLGGTIMKKVAVAVAALLALGIAGVLVVDVVKPERTSGDNTRASDAPAIVSDAPGLAVSGRPLPEKRERHGEPGKAELKDQGTQLNGALIVAVTTQGRPLADAAVTIRSKAPGSSSRAESVSAQTDVDGVARFSKLVHRGRYKVTVQLTPITTFVFTAAAMAEEKPYRLDLLHELVMLRGTVREATSDGPGVGGATISVRTPLTRIIGISRRSAWYETRFQSGPRGGFEIRIPRGSISQVRVEASGFAPWPRLGFEHRIQAQRRLRGLSGTEPVTCDFVLQRGGVVAGFIRTDAGLPLERATVVLWPKVGRAAASTTTASDGSYRIEAVNPGAYRVDVQASDWTPVRDQAQAVDVPEGAEAAPQRLDVVMTRARRLQGIVYRADGSPAAGVRVFAVANHFPVLKPTATGPDGRWVLNVRPNWPTVFVRASHEGLQAVPVRVDLDAKTIAPIPLTLAPAGTLRGVVTDDDGPVPDAVVWLVTDTAGHHNRNTRTGADGAYAFPAVREGLWTVRPQKKEYLRQEATAVRVAVTGDTHQPLVLDAGGTISGTVFDPDGKVVPGVGVWVNTPGEDPKASFTHRVHAAKDGTFVVRTLPHGAHAIWAGKYGLEMDPLVVRTGESNLRLELRTKR